MSKRYNNSSSYSFSYSTDIGEDAKTNKYRKECKTRANSTPDIIRQLIWNTANTDKRHSMESYFMIMEFLCCEYDAECVESLKNEDYDSFIKALDEGKWRT